MLNEPDKIERDTGQLLNTFDELDRRTQGLERSTQRYAQTIAQAFTGAVANGKKFDDVLKSVALRLSNMALQAAIRPVTGKIAGGIQGVFDNIFGGIFGGGARNVPPLAAALGAIKPFAAGGVVGTPTYFPLSSGGVGLAGEAGPEAILPLSRGADGKLGVSAGSAAAGPNIAIHIATPDAESFRRSEAYITGQIARAVARGQRSL
ncbi:MAG: phage tail tape measure protein [Xanthobacteraceae bacterium]